MIKDRTWNADFRTSHAFVDWSSARTDENLYIFSIVKPALSPPEDNVQMKTAQRLQYAEGSEVDYF